MAGSEDEKAAVAAGRGYRRPSRTDREQAIDVLKAAFVQGRLTKDEFDARIGLTFTARVRGTGRGHRRRPRAAGRGPAAAQAVPAADKQRGQVGRSRVHYASHNRLRFCGRVCARCW